MWFFNDAICCPNLSEKLRWKHNQHTFDTSFHYYGDKLPAHIQTTLESSGNLTNAVNVSSASAVCCLELSLQLLNAKLLKVTAMNARHNVMMDTRWQPGSFGFTSVRREKMKMRRPSFYTVE